MTLTVGSFKEFVYYVINLFLKEKNPCMSGFLFRVYLLLQLSICASQNLLSCDCCAICNSGCAALNKIVLTCKTLSLFLLFLVAEYPTVQLMQLTAESSLLSPRTPMKRWSATRSFAQSGNKPKLSLQQWLGVSAWLMKHGEFCLPPRIKRNKPKMWKNP